MQATVSPVREFSREVADALPDVVYFLDSALRIVHCNPAWDTFACQNRGERAVASQVVGTPLFNYVAPDLQPFYRIVFDSCASDSLPFSFDYECSSSAIYRLFRMQIFPLRKREGFAIVNALRIEQPHSRAPQMPGREYLANGNTITVCAHCRRTRREDDLARWDWVPAHLEAGELRLNQAVCPPCRSYFYGLTSDRLSPGSLLHRDV